MSTRNILQLIAGTLAVAVITAILYPVFAKAKEVSRRTCSPKLYSIGIAMLVYAEDNDDRLPSANWCTAIQSIGGNQRLIYPDQLTCTAMEKRNQKWGFAMNIDYVGAKLHTINDPAKAILVFECDALAENVVANLAARSLTRHGRGSVVAYANGKAKHLTEPEEP